MQNHLLPRATKRRVLLALLLACMAFGVTAQSKLKFSIADFDVDQFDFSAKDPQYEKYDGNGDRYAIIKVTSNNPKDNLTEYNFNFGNMKHIVVPHDGVLWVYVQKNAKMVSITREGYLPINKYDLHTTIESGGNYVMSLTSEDKKVYTQMVRFNVKPADSRAVVMIKSFKEGAVEELFGNTDETGSVAKGLEYGTYSYKILADNYHPCEGRITLNNRNITYAEDVTLRPNFSTMTFVVDANADIYINGERKGFKRWSGRLKAGNYQVECRQANHRASSQYVEVSENDNRTITLQAPKPIYGTASITSTPLGAEMTIDGKPFGETPKSFNIAIGKHTLELSKIGYQTLSIPFEIKEEETTPIDITLSKTTLVEIEANVQSRVEIDGNQLGYTPVNYNGEAGQHTIKIECDGYSTIKKKVYLGNTKKIKFNLQKKYTKATDIYVEGGVGYNIGYGATLTIGVGAHFKNFNAEFDYSYGFSKSPTIYWNYTGDNSYLLDRPVATCTYSPNLFSAKIGYGFNIGSRLKITPQAGYRFSKLDSHSSETHNLTGAYCSSITIGARVYLAIIPHFGISLSPEYAIGVARSEGFRTLSEVTSKIKNMGEGFNTKLSFVYNYNF